jgi:hypothetical protein
MGELKTSDTELELTAIDCAMTFSKLSGALSHKFFSTRMILSRFARLVALSSSCISFANRYVRDISRCLARNNIDTEFMCVEDRCTDSVITGKEHIIAWNLNRLSSRWDLIIVNGAFLLSRYLTATTLSVARKHRDNRWWLTSTVGSRQFCWWSLHFT